METRQEHCATPESHRQSTQMTLSAEDELAGQLKKKGQKGAVRPQHSRALQKWCHSMPVNRASGWDWGHPGSQRHESLQQQMCIPFSLANTCPCSSTEFWSTPQGRSEPSRAPGKGLYFIPAVLLTSSVHLGEGQGEPWESF